MATGVIVELQRNSPNWTTVVEDIVKLERQIFPKHESLARSFDAELRKKNSGLLYREVDREVAGYVMYSWPSSLYASITKLAGLKTHLLSWTIFIHISFLRFLLQMWFLSIYSPRLNIMFKKSSDFLLFFFCLLVWLLWFVLVLMLCGLVLFMCGYEMINMKLSLNVIELSKMWIYVFFFKVTMKLISGTNLVCFLSGFHCLFSRHNVSLLKF